MTLRPIGTTFELHYETCNIDHSSHWPRKYNEEEGKTTFRVVDYRKDALGRLCEVVESVEVDESTFERLVREGEGRN